MASASSSMTAADVRARAARSSLRPAMPVNPDCAKQPLFFHGHVFEQVAEIDTLVCATNGPTATGRGLSFAGSYTTGDNLRLADFAMNRTGDGARSARGRALGLGGSGVGARAVAMVLDFARLRGAREVRLFSGRFVGRVRRARAFVRA